MRYRILFTTLLCIAGLCNAQNLENKYVAISNSVKLNKKSLPNNEAIFACNQGISLDGSDDFINCSSPLYGNCRQNLCTGYLFTLLIERELYLRERPAKMNKANVLNIRV